MTKWHWPPTRREVVVGLALGSIGCMVITLLTPPDGGLPTWLIFAPLVGLPLALILRWLWGVEIDEWFKDE